jgi:uncharacterized membrane protein
VPSATHSVLIRRPLDEVFAFVMDKSNDVRWRTGIAEIAHVSGEGVGATYRQLVNGPGGRKIPADFEITRLEPNQRLDFQTIAGPVRPRGTFTFAGEGAETRVTFALAADLRGAKILMAPLVARSMRHEVQGLERLKHVLEDAPTDAG